jgi:hypothetical protein
VLKRAFEGVGQDLHVSMAVGPEPGPGLHAVVVDHPQRPEAHARGIPVTAEREGVSAVEPALIRAASLPGGSNPDHRVISFAPRTGGAGNVSSLTGYPNATHFAIPPSRGWTRVIPRRLSSSATRALVASFGQEQ